MTRKRYLVFFLMFLVIAINYMDRVNFSVAIPAIRHVFGFSLQGIGTIAFVWGIFYAVANFPGGWIADRLGLRWGIFTAFGWWSVFTIATPFAGSFPGWLVVRGLMGAGEAPIWPLNSKSANAWASPSERSTAFTWAGSGQYVGPAIGTLLAGWIVVHLGWQWAFILFGVAGLILLPIWLYVVRDTPAHDPAIGKQELEWIGNREPSNEKADWTGIKEVFFSRTGLALLIVYLTFGYILFTFLYWVPSYMYYTFHMGILKSSAWASLGALLGFAGFILSGPFNDGLAARMDKLNARRIGVAVPMLVAAGCIVISLWTAGAGLGGLTAALIGLAQLLMNMTVGAWAVTVIDISPNQASTGFVYGIYNGVLNVMGAFNSLILTAIAARLGFPTAFGSAVLFMLLFVGSFLFLIDRPSYTHLIDKAAGARALAAA